MSAGRRAIARLRSLRPRAVVRRSVPVVTAPARAVGAAAARRLRRPDRLAVSVVVAAYNSDQVGLRRLFGSLDRQTMPRRDFEVIVVDDGSTDDTLRRLRRLARTRSNVVVRSIPNSGWSSRPRNVAIGIARGDFVLFADHDDELFPEALQRCHDHAVTTRADVVNPKEVRTRGWSWGWREFDVNRAPGDTGSTVPLAPMTPHKLYRREFIDQHGIRFPEGRRVLWEDIHFNVDCLAAGARVAVLADHPIYHWVMTDENNSSTFGRDVHEIWDHLAQLLDRIDAVLAPTPWHRPLLTLQMRGRVLDAVGPRLLKRAPKNRVVARDRARDVFTAHADRLLAGELTPVDLARRDLLLGADLAAQEALARFDQETALAVEVESVRWEGRSLVVAATARLVDAAGTPVRFRRDGERWTRVLPAALDGLVSPEALDVTDALSRAEFRLSVRGRASRSTWPVPGEGSVSVVEDGDGDGGGTGHLVGRVEGRFPVGPTGERQWDEPIWDFGARLEAFGLARHGPLTGGTTAVALLDGRPAVAYRNRRGALSLDTAGTPRALTSSDGPALAEPHVLVTEPGRRPVVDLTAVLTQVHAAGPARITGHVVLGGGGRLPATVEVRDGRAVLHCAGPVPVGDHQVRTRFAGRTGETGMSLRVGTDSAVLHG